MEIERLSTGVVKIDEMLKGGIPKGFFVAVVGEPGCGKTIFCMHFIHAGLRRGEKAIFVTTEESRESIIRQAKQFGMKYSEYIEKEQLVIVDALMKLRGDPYTLSSLNPEELVEKLISIKRRMGYEHVRLVIDSLSAFWLDKPAMARRYSYMLKKILYQWNFTVLATSQYAITTSEAFGFGVEHVADGIIRFRRSLKKGILKRYVIIEKMRQTDHDLRMHEIAIIDGKGLTVLGPVEARREDIALPEHVIKKIVKSSRKAEEEIP